MKWDRSVFREYDIRGIWNENINEEFSFMLGKAFGWYLKNTIKKESLSVSVGYDARLSSPAIFNALSNGLISYGVDVYDIGLVPTPVQYFSLFNTDVDGGIMITASHNPKDYNGFKLSVGKETLFGDQIKEFAEIMEKIENLKGPNKKGKLEKLDVQSRYKSFMLNQFGYLKDYSKKPRFALDGGNGVAGKVGYEIFEELGYDVKGLFIEPDGTFPNHHPDPTVEKNLVDLKKSIKENKLDFGIGYDGDGDRIGVVLSDGSILWGDQLLLLFSQDLCKNNKNAKVVLDVKCSDVIFDLIRQAGCNPIMFKTGHSLIKNKMKQEKALLAGEMSGHIFMADRYFGFDDAIYVSLRLVEIATRDGVDLLSWKKSLPEVYNTPEIRIDCPDDRKTYVIEMFKSILNNKKGALGIIDINTIDGVRFKTGYGWGLVRASNTQPALVLRFEANSEENLAKLKGFTLKSIEELLRNG